MDTSVFLTLISNFKTFTRPYSVNSWELCISLIPWGIFMTHDKTPTALFAGNVFANYRYTRTEPSTLHRDGPLASACAERLEVKPKLLTTEDTTDALPFCLFSFLWLLHSFFYRWAALIFTFHLTFCCQTPPLHSLRTLTVRPPSLIKEVAEKKAVPPMGTSSDDKLNAKTGLRSAESDKTPETAF